MRVNGLARPRTIQEDHKDGDAPRGGRAQDLIGRPYKTDKHQRWSGSGPYRRAIQDGEAPEGSGPGPYRRAIQDGESPEGFGPRNIRRGG